MEKGGGLAYAGTAVAEAVITEQWKQLVFPVSLRLESRH
jgi:hypothetical protein